MFEEIILSTFLVKIHYIMRKIINLIHYSFLFLLIMLFLNRIMN